MPAFSPPLCLAGRVLLQSVRDLLIDNGPQWAAAIAYYGLLSLFPSLLAAASIAAYFIDPAWAIIQATGLLGDLLPQGAATVATIVRGAFDARGMTGLFSLILLLWTGSLAFGTLAQALSIAFDVDEVRGYFRRLAIRLAMLFTAGVLFAAGLLSFLLLSPLGQLIDAIPASLIPILGQGMPAVLVFTAFFLVYRFVPRGRCFPKSALIGAGVAVALFLAARPLFFTYVEEFARYNLVYGSLAVVVALLLWAWVTALIALFGGEVASHVQMMVFEGESGADVEQRHEARSPNKRWRHSTPARGTE